MKGLPEKIVAIHEALTEAALPHAFGGALALAWCTGRARATIDIDINVFTNGEDAEKVFAALPDDIKHAKKEVNVLRKEGQVRLWWDKTPVDVFLNTTEFHEEAAHRTRWETFMQRRIPFLSCRDLAVFKAFFNRTKDWADLEEMQAAGTLQITEVRADLTRYLGSDDQRLDHLAALAATSAD